MITFRTIVRTIVAGDNGTFDGVTQESADGYTPAPTANARSRKSSDQTVGRFGFGVLGAKGNAPKLIRVRTYAAAPGDKYQVRSGIAADVGNGSYTAAELGLPIAPADSLLSEHTLTTAWGPWVLTGPTDSIAVVKPLGVGDSGTVEFLIAEGPDAELHQLMCCNGCECDEACFVPTVTVVAEDPEGLPVAIEVWTSCDVAINAVATVAGQEFVLPSIADVGEGASALFRRQAGAWFTVSAPNGINGTAPGNKIIFEDLRESVLFRATANGWSATKLVSFLAPTDAANPIALWAGQAVRRVRADSPTYTLPPTSEVAPGELLWLTNETTGDGRHDVALVLDDPTNEAIDGILGGRAELPNTGDTLLLLRDGGNGFRTVANTFGRSASLVDLAGAAPIFTEGWRGTRAFRFTDVAAAIVVNLPPLTSNVPVGCRLHGFRNLAGTLTFSAQPAGATIIGAGNDNQLATVTGENSWGFLEYEGGGVWSFHE